MKRSIRLFSEEIVQGAVLPLTRISVYIWLMYAIYGKKQKQGMHWHY